ncbi:MAG TPA: AMP-binding protein [Candidatus Saccharimonadia bacterium]|nr:AMP-binding protein [Candidatus Saccharimonadia bacterium]
MNASLDRPHDTPGDTVAWLDGNDPGTTIAIDRGRAVSLAAFRDDVSRLAAQLPPHGAMVDLCEDRYQFLVAFAAAAVRGHPVLLPGSRAPEVVAEARAQHAGAYLHDDSMHGLGGDARARLPAGLPARQVAAYGYTSGSTGAPKRHEKTWGAFAATTRLNAAAIVAALTERGIRERPQLVATVPPQHMYGMETSILLPLLAGMAVHGARPLFPADVAAALAELSGPRVLVTTPVHLRALAHARVTLPPIALALSATAPLPVALAREAEAALGAPIVEMFGSTETCVIATRRAALEEPWQAYDGVALDPRPDGVHVHAPWLHEPTPLLDLVELLPGGRFELRGRNADLLEIAGKRASLADLTRRVLAIDGVRDAVVFQPDGEGPVRRVAALVVAPGLAAGAILERLRAATDPAFLPRPLVLVDTLPRNEVGKLPRDRLLAALARGTREV